MLERMKTYVLDLFARWQASLKDRETKIIATDELCCIDITANSFSIAYARKQKEKLQLVFCANYPFNDAENLQESLSTVVKYHQLDKVPCLWILQPDQYQLLLIEALPVPPNEFQAAVRWKIKDLIRFPVNDAIIDSFPLPIKKPPNSQDMIMVVAAKLNEVKSTSDQLEAAGLQLRMINIMELSLCNAASFSEKENKTTAFLYIQEKNSQILIMSNKKLHFNRRIDLGSQFFAASDLNETQIAEKMDRLALEIQRSFDYYQSQWRQLVPAQIIYSSVKTMDYDFSGLLSQRLSMPVEKLNLNSVLLSAKPLSEEEMGQYLPVIGGLFTLEGSGNAKS